VYVEAPNVEFRCTHHVGPNTLLTYRDGYGYGAGLLLEDVHLEATTAAINFKGWDGGQTAIRLKTYPSGSDGIAWFGGLLRDSYIDTYNDWLGGSGTHDDGITSQGTFYPLWLIHNTVLQRDGSVSGNSTFFANNSWTLCKDITLDSNFMRGGISTIHTTCDQWRLTNNTFDSRTTLAGSRIFDVDPVPPGGCMEESGNEDYDGTPVSTGDATGGIGFCGVYRCDNPPCTEHDDYDGISPIPTWNVSTVTVTPSSCTDNDAACDNVDLSASVSGNVTGGSTRWRYSCGGSPSNILSPDPSTRSHQDGGADLWYHAPQCDGQSTCTLRDVCDFINEGPGTYTVKMYSEPGPGAQPRPSDHTEATFTVNP
jgi:hypothetical protein